MQFDFGQNWLNFSQKKLTLEKVQQARLDFADLLDSIDLKGKLFLDIGFGQGLSLFSAAQKGAKVIGNDINPKCADVLRMNISYYSELNISDIPVVIGSILNNPVVDELIKKTPSEQGYDIVHSWGVLHHTGDMEKAINNTASLVKRKGYLILAIYNQHWTSPLWKRIKWFYCKSTPFVQKLMVKLFYPIIWLTKFIVTGKNPKKQSRGMDFYYDIIDWVGGYPYEYAYRDSLINFVESLGFVCEKVISAQVPTGCNEFIFKKSKNLHKNIRENTL